MLPRVLDEQQLARIQGIHRGFLYQHLYSAACLLAGPQSGLLELRAERDEDAELVHAGLTLYAQIKTRSQDLYLSALPGLFERFDVLQAAHVSKRPGVARCALVTNTDVSPSVQKLCTDHDVLLVTPSTPAASLTGTGLLVPTRTLDELIREAVSLAGRVQAVRAAAR